MSAITNNRKGTTEVVKCTKPPVKEIPEIGVPVAGTISGLFDSITTCSTPLSALIKEASEGVWTVNSWYRANYGGDDLASTHDSHVSGVHQTYTRLDQVEMTVISGLSNSVDADTNISEATGEGKVDTMVRPNIGDIFIAEAFEGGLYSFKVTSVQLSSVTSTPKYIVSYKMFDYIDSPAHHVLTDLNAKTGEVLVFNNTAGEVTLNSAEEVATATDYKCASAKLQKTWLDTYKDTDTNLLLLKVGNTSIYDYHLVKFVDVIFKGITGFGLDRIPVNRKNHPGYTLFDDLLNTNRFRDDADPIVTVHDSNSFTLNRYLSNVRYFPVSNIVVSDATQAPETSVEIDHLLPTWDSTVNYPSVKLNESYVLPVEYYNGTPTDTFSTLVRDYIKNRTVDKSQLNIVLDDYKSLGYTEKFYFTPILIQLLNVAGT